MKPFYININLKTMRTSNLAMEYACDDAQTSDNIDRTVAADTTTPTIAPALPAPHPSSQAIHLPPAALSNSHVTLRIKPTNKQWHIQIPIFCCFSL